MPNARLDTIVEDIRVFLRDNLHRNDLLERLEFTDLEIQRAMQMAVDDFDLITPISNTKISAFPSRVLLILGTTAYLLWSESFAQIRNSLSYSDGGVQVNVDDKAALYQQSGTALMAQFKDAATNLKIQINAESAFGGQASPYSSLPVF